MLVNTAWSNLHVCSWVSKSETALHYFVVTPLDPEISTLPSLFKACLQCSFRCFLHTALSCYPYIRTPNFQLCILAVHLDSILDTFEVSFVTISFLILIIWERFYYLSSFQMPFCGHAGPEETGSSIFLVFPISNFSPLVPNLWTNLVSFCAVTLNTHFYLDFPYIEQPVLPVLTAEFLLHI